MTNEHEKPFWTDTISSLSQLNLFSFKFELNDYQPVVTSQNCCFDNENPFKHDTRFKEKHGKLLPKATHKHKNITQQCEK